MWKWNTDQNKHVWYCWISYPNFPQNYKGIYKSIRQKETHGHHQGAAAATPFISGFLNVLHWKGSYHSYLYNKLLT